MSSRKRKPSIEKDQISCSKKANIEQVDTSGERKGSDELFKKIEALFEGMADKLETYNEQVARGIEDRIMSIETSNKQLNLGITATTDRLKRLENSIQTAKPKEDISGQRTEAGIAVPKAGDYQGQLRLVFSDNDLENAPGSELYSDAVRIAGAKWCLNVQKWNLDKEGFLGWGYYENISKNGIDLVDQNGNFTVLAEFNFTAIVAEESLSVYKSVPANDCDCTLLVDGHRIDVNKMFLSMFSPYFEALFNSNFRENDQTEIEIKGVLYAEFIELLAVIYPSNIRHKITGDNVECLLNMADRFLVKQITENCEDFLMQCPVENVCLERKLLLADEYQLKELQTVCIEQYKNLPDKGEFEGTTEFGMLGREIKELLENASNDP